MEANGKIGVRKRGRWKYKDVSQVGKWEEEEKHDREIEIG